MDGAVWVYNVRPDFGGFSYAVPDTSNGCGARMDHSNPLPDLQPGSCRMFVEFAPRVAESDEPSALVWNGGTWDGRLAAERGDIILPFGAIPDPTPYLTQTDPKAARRAEIDAQIAALQAERNRLEA